ERGAELLEVSWHGSGGDPLQVPVAELDLGAARQVAVDRDARLELHQSEVRAYRPRTGRDPVLDLERAAPLTELPGLVAQPGELELAGGLGLRGGSPYPRAARQTSVELLPLRSHQLHERE